MKKYFGLFVLGGVACAATLEPGVVVETLTLFQALILGIVEGITEYLPVSSTGHLILTSHLLGLDNPALRSADQLEALEAFEIIIQGGAILAVAGLYQLELRRMGQGLIFFKSKDELHLQGRKLFFLIMAALMPTLVVGFLLKKVISSYLFGPGPVVIALLVGGVFMVRTEKMQSLKDRAIGDIQTLSMKDAFIIGCLQCLALWPGTSRSMATILAGMFRGLKPAAAAKFSFLLGLPTLSAATIYKFYKSYHVLEAHISSAAMAIGFISSAIVAWFAVRGLVSYLSRRGLAVFGWYRIVLAVLMSVLLFSVNLPL